MRKLPYIILAVGISGCATIPPLATPSGQPEVMLQGVKLTDAKLKTEELCKQTEGKVVQATEASLVCYRPAPPAVRQVLRFNAYEYLHLELTETPAGVRVHAIKATYDGMGPFGGRQQHSTDLKGTAISQGIQSQLETLTK